MYLCTQNYDLKRGGTFETAMAGTFHSVTAGTLIPLFTGKGRIIIHNIDNTDHLIGYIREEDDMIVFTNPEGDEYTITFNE